MPIQSEQWHQVVLKVGPEAGATSDGMELKLGSGDTGDGAPQPGISIQVSSPSGLVPLAIPADGKIPLATGSDLYQRLISPKGLTIFIKRDPSVDQLHHLSLNLMPKANSRSTGPPIQCAALDLLPVEVVPDYNRDGKIDSADRGKVTTEKPFHWWINDDNDLTSAERGEGNQDIPSSNSPDHANGQVDGMRDLIDFFPIHLDIRQALLVLPKSEYQYFIKHSEGGLKLIEFPSGEPDPSEADLSRSPNSHLTNTSRASGLANYAVTPVTSAGVPISNSYLNQAKDGKGLLLLEATKETTSPVQLEIRKGSQVIATINFPVKISKVENIYRHIDLTQVPLDYDGGSPGAAASPIGTKTVDPSSAYPDSLTNGNYFVFLHGFNVPVHRARGWNAEIFKRMHQMGSKARFVGITWTGATGIPIAGTPSNIGNAESSTDYHKAVFFAMQTGGAFAPALAFTQGADVTVAAHSLGNMVVGEAIQNGGFTPSRYTI